MVVGVIGVSALAAVVLFVAWRHPERACLRCKGQAWLCRLSPILRLPVRGACRGCGGRGWKQRRLSKVFGWGANTHRGSDRW